MAADLEQVDLLLLLHIVGSEALNDIAALLQAVPQLSCGCSLTGNLCLQLAHFGKVLLLFLCTQARLHLGCLLQIPLYLYQCLQ